MQGHRLSAPRVFVCRMLKTNNQNRILNTLSTTLPDDRPITAIQIVEYVEKCPRGFLAISKTHDQDQDADLWRDSSFLKRNKSGRYLCLSKSEGLPNFVVQDITIVQEKSPPPEGFSLLYRTADTEQKAWRKRQLCYRLVNSRHVNQAVTDIIVCNRLKKAPVGFTLAGEINGMTICYKMGNVQDTPNSENQNASPPDVPRKNKITSPPGQPTSMFYPPLSGDSASDHDYEILLPNYTPTRPAPGPPPPSVTPSNACNTLGGHAGLEGVPFVLNSRLQGSSSGTQPYGPLPVVKARTLLQLNRDYDYDFRAERHS